MKREAEPSPSELQKLVKKVAGIELADAPFIVDVFLQKIVLNPVVGVHEGLLSSVNIYQGSDSRILSICLQGIDPKIGERAGRVKEHDHGSEGVTEIIITQGHSVYAGLPKGEILGEYKVFLVPPGLRHGSDTQPTYGRWVSIKLKF